MPLKSPESAAYASAPNAGSLHAEEKLWSLHHFSSCGANATAHLKTISVSRQLTGQPTGKIQFAGFALMMMKLQQSSFFFQAFEITSLKIVCYAIEKYVCAGKMTLTWQRSFGSVVCCVKQSNEAQKENGRTDAASFNPLTHYLVSHADNKTRRTSSCERKLASSKKKEQCSKTSGHTTFTRLTGKLQSNI